MVVVASIIITIHGIMLFAVSGYYHVPNFPVAEYCIHGSKASRTSPKFMFGFAVPNFLSLFISALHECRTYLFIRKYAFGSQDNNPMHGKSISSQQNSGNNQSYVYCSFTKHEQQRKREETDAPRTATEGNNFVIKPIFAIRFHGYCVLQIFPGFGDTGLLGFFSFPFDCQFQVSCCGSYHLSKK